MIRIRTRPCGASLQMSPQGLAAYLLLVLALCLPLHVRASSSDSRLVLALGDSVTSGYGLSGEQAYPAVLRELLAQAGHPSVVINAGVSGDTTSGGLARLPGYYPPCASRAPDLLILELGANDAIQRIGLEQVEANLHAIIDFARRNGSQVLLTGIGAGLKRNDGYRTALTDMYRRVAEKHGIAFLPLIGSGIKRSPTLVQSDGAHPNAEGARVIASGLTPLVIELLRGKHIAP
jgi:acyl-CoA thioesterase-1